MAWACFPHWHLLSEVCELVREGEQACRLRQWTIVLLSTVEETIIQSGIYIAEEQPAICKASWCGTADRTTLQHYEAIHIFLASWVWLWTGSVQAELHMVRRGMNWSFFILKALD